MNKWKLYFASVLLLSNVGCASVASTKYQNRANEFHFNVENFAAAGPNIDDFIRKFGPATACAKLQTGSLCEWDSAVGSVGATMLMANRNPYMGSTGGYNALAVSRHHQISKLLRVEFDKSGVYVKCQAIIRRGDKEFIGQ